MGSGVKLVNIDAVELNRIFSERVDSIKFNIDKVEQAINGKDWYSNLSMVKTLSGINNIVDDFVKDNLTLIGIKTVIGRKEFIRKDTKATGMFDCVDSINLDALEEAIGVYKEFEGVFNGLLNRVKDLDHKATLLLTTSRFIRLLDRPILEPVKCIIPHNDTYNITYGTDQVLLTSFKNNVKSLHLERCKIDFTPNVELYGLFGEFTKGNIIFIFEYEYVSYYVLYHPELRSACCYKEKNA